MLKHLFEKNSPTSTLEIDVSSVMASNVEESVSIIDVRELHEWQGGHIDGAIHIPLGELAQRVSEVDASRPVVTVCRSGRRSLEAVRLLEAAGVKDVKSMAGGMIAWQKAGQPTTR